MTARRQYHNIYNQLLNDWIRQFEQQIDPEDCFRLFIESLYNKTRLRITYDAQIQQVFKKRFEDISHQNYNQKYQSRKRKKLFQIVQILKNYRFINQRSYTNLIKYKNIHLKDLLLKFYNRLNQHKPFSQRDPQLIRNCWQLQMPVQMYQFWKLMETKKVKDQLLFMVYPQISKMPQIKTQQKIQNYFQKILKPIFNPESQQKKTSITDNFMQRYRNILNSAKDQSITQNTNRIVPKLTNQKKQPTTFKIQLPKKESYQFKTALVTSSLENIHISQQKQKPLWDTLFGSQPYQQFQHFLQKKFNSTQTIQLDRTLLKIAFEQSLFFNRDHSLLLFGAQKIMQKLNQLLLYHGQIQKIDLFGSLRSRLAIKSDFDFDVTIIKKRQTLLTSQRQDAINVLFQVNNHMPQLDWIQIKHVVRFQKVPVPYLKLILNKPSFQYHFGICGMQKIDITVGNQTAINNSRLLSRYAQNQDIALFCLLVKIWAKKNTIIDPVTPMNGLSGYALMLMCIYFLMESQQIPKLCLPQQPQQQFNPSKIEIDAKSFKIDNIFHNFVGFLDFYGQNGRVRRQKLIVSLITNPTRTKFDQNIIINMYDFIDNTNPGRLTRVHQTNFFHKLQNAKNIMLSKEINQIQRLFQ